MKLKVYSDPTYKRGGMIFRGSSVIAAGFIHAPFVPLNIAARYLERSVVDQLADLLKTAIERLADLA